MQLTLQKVLSFFMTVFTQGRLWLDDHRTYFNALKVGLSVLICYVLILQLQSYFIYPLQSFLSINWSLLLVGLPLLTFLSCVNWSLEGYKRWICEKQAKSLRASVEDVLLGLAANLLMPAGSGDHMVRTGTSVVGDHQRALSGSLISSWLQNAVNLLVGGSILFCSDIELLGISGCPLGTGALVLGVALFIFSIYCDKLMSLFWPSSEEYGYSNSEVLNLLVASLMRYIVYLSQFVFVIWLLQVNLSIFILAKAVAVVFVVQSCLPLPSVLGALARVEIAVLILSYHLDNELLIVVSSLCIWIINSAGPTLLGTIVMFKKRKIETKHYKSNCLSELNGVDLAR